MRRMIDTWAPAGLAAAISAVWLSAAPGRPWSLLLLAAIAASLLVLGSRSPLLLALFGASAAAVLAVLAFWASESTASETNESICDPSCGISLGGALVLTVPAAIVITLVGWSFAALLRLVRR